MTSSFSNLLTKPILTRLYTDLEKTDKEIAGFFNLDRTTIVHARKEFGIKTRDSTGRSGELIAIEELRRLGYQVSDMNEIDRLSDFDLLINGHIKAEVKTSVQHGNRFYFLLTEQEKNGMAVSDKRIRLNNGRTKKVFEKTCDIIIFVGIGREKENHFWVMPPGDIALKLQTLSASLRSSKYSKYLNRWDLIERGD